MLEFLCQKFESPLRNKIQNNTWFLHLTIVQMHVKKQQLELDMEQQTGFK